MSTTGDQSRPRSGEGDALEEEGDQGECGGSTSSPPISVERNVPSLDGVAPSEQAGVDADLVARNLIAELRQENPGLQGRAVVSEPLARAFVRRYLRMVAELGIDRAQPRVVFHGTQPQNFDAIIAGNLRVPDGVTLVSATGRSTYGQGIYVASDFDIALAYGMPPREAREGAGAAGAADGAPLAEGPAPAKARALQRAPSAIPQAQAQQQMAFVCLALPGRQHVSKPPYDTACRTVRPNFDSHVSADRGGAISVFFDPSQLLPCFLTTRASLICAQEAAVRAVDALIKAAPPPARGDDSSEGGDAGSTKSEPELETQSVQNFVQQQSLQSRIPGLLPQLAPNFPALAWLRGPAAGATVTTATSELVTPSQPAAEGAAAGSRRPRVGMSAAPLPAFATAEWDGVQKRVRYS